MIDVNKKLGFGNSFDMVGVASSILAVPTTKTPENLAFLADSIKKLLAEHYRTFKEQSTKLHKNVCKMCAKSYGAAPCSKSGYEVAPDSPALIRKER